MSYYNLHNYSIPFSKNINAISDNKYNYLNAFFDSLSKEERSNLIKILFDQLNENVENIFFDKNKTIDIYSSLSYDNLNMLTLICFPTICYYLIHSLNINPMMLPDEIILHIRSLTTKSSKFK